MCLRGVMLSQRHHRQPLPTQSSTSTHLATDVPLAKSSKGLGTSTSTSRTLSNAKWRPGAYRMPKPSAMGALECSKYLVSAWKHFEMQWWRPYCTWYPQCDRNCQVMLRTGGTKKKTSPLSAHYRARGRSTALTSRPVL